MNNNIKKDILWNIIGTSFYAFASLIFLIIVTRINGVTEAGIFTYSFATACLFYTISIYSTRTYQVTEKNKEYTDYDYFYNRGTTCLIMILTAILFSFIKGYDLIKSSILVLLCLLKCIETIEEVIYGIFQKNNKLNIVGKSLTIRSILEYIIFFIVDIITENIIISIISLLVINIINILIYDIKYLRKINITKSNYSNVKNINLLKSGFNTFAFSFLSLYLINSSRYAIDNYLEENIQTIFGIIVMPATVMPMLSQFIIQPFLVNINNLIHNQEFNKLKKLIMKIMLIMLLIGLIVILVGALIGIPVLNIIYGLNLNKYRIDLVIILIGALFYGLSMIISNILVAYRKTFSQLIILFSISIFSLFSSSFLVMNYNLLGASINYFIIMFLQIIIYLILLFYYFKKIEN